MNLKASRRNKLFNALMAVLIAVIVFCGVMAVGTIRGWFDGEADESDVITSKVTGIANIERNGVGYNLEENTPLKVSDIAQTTSGAEAELTIADKNSFILGSETEAEVKANKADDIDLAVTGGEVFADTPEAGDKFDVEFGENTAHITGTVFSVSVQKGADTLNVYEGSVKVDISDGSQEVVTAGQSLSIVKNSDTGDISATVSELEAGTLSDFIIEKALACEDSDKLCFTAGDLQKVADARAAENEAAEESADGGETITADEDGDGATASSSSSKSSKKSSSSSNAKTCTISIRCDTILKNMSDLSAGKNKYVPSNGVILSSSRVEFSSGETVFDVLKRVCSATGIQLEYSYTPMYGSYYIEGINHLYEFDCGSQSGWMYKVNGWFPNYGCSSYTLKNGDNIVWCYTCKGLGSDL